MQFVNNHRSSMRLGMFSTTAGGTQTQRNETIVTKYLPDKAGAVSNASKQTVDDTAVEHLTDVSKKATVTVTLIGFRDGIVASNDAMFGTVNEHSQVSYVKGKLDITLTDDLITEIKPEVGDEE